MYRNRFCACAEAELVDSHEHATLIHTRGPERAVQRTEPSLGTAGVDQVLQDLPRRWLFKSVTVKQAHIHGEDWAEKAVTQLASLLGIPCARIELAEMRGAPGCIGTDLRPPLHELQHGQVLLEERGAPGYIHGKGKVHPGHSLENIHPCKACCPARVRTRFRRDGIRCFRWLPAARRVGG